MRKGPIIYVQQICLQDKIPASYDMILLQNAEANDEVLKDTESFFYWKLIVVTMAAVKCYQKLLQTITQI